MGVILYLKSNYLKLIYLVIKINIFKIMLKYK